MDHNTITENTAWKQKKNNRNFAVQENPIEQGASHRTKPSWKDTCDEWKLVSKYTFWSIDWEMNIFLFTHDVYIIFSALLIEIHGELEERKEFMQKPYTYATSNHESYFTAREHVC